MGLIPREDGTNWEGTWFFGYTSFVIHLVVVDCSSPFLAVEWGGHNISAKLTVLNGSSSIVAVAVGVL